MRKADKREHRETKRIVKRAGHKHVRNTVKRVLNESPEEAVDLKDDFGRYRSDVMNGIDNDSTRTRINRVDDHEDQSYSPCSG